MKLNIKNKRLGDSYYDISSIDGYVWIKCGGNRKMNFGRRRLFINGVGVDRIINTIWMI